MATLTSNSSSLGRLNSTASTVSYSSSETKQRWIELISKILEEEDKVVDTCVSIFRVPKALSNFKPEAYAPQLMGLGPYHHFHPELFEMERYKLASAIRFKKSQRIEFDELIAKLYKFDNQIRACYHKYLDFEGDGLVRFMVLDGLFLLEFLHDYTTKKRKTARLVDSGGNQLTHHAIISDIMMLENQIPIFLLREIFSIQCPSPDTVLPFVLLDFCKAVSPLNWKNQGDPCQVSSSAHLLDLLYYLIVPKKREGSSVPPGYHAREACNVDIPPAGAAACEGPAVNSGNTEVFPKLWSVLSNLNNRWVRKFTTPIRALVGMPWDVVKGLDISNLGSNDEEKIVMVEEIMIPSVSLLYDAGVKFCPSPSPGDITTVHFDKKKKKFYLPVITLTVNSEVIIRNLVAYEASIATTSLDFARYIELMSGIIDTPQDAKLLRDKKIIVNSSQKKDDEVAQLFNGMTKSIRLSKVSYIDTTIEDVNKFFSSRPKVRIYRSVKKYVYGSWKMLTLLAALLLILLMGVQSFCTVYKCPRIMNDIS